MPEKTQRQKTKMITKSKVLLPSMIVIMILSGFLVYDYGIVRVLEKTDEMKDQYNTKIKMINKYKDLIAQKPLVEKQIADLKEAGKRQEAKMMTAQTIAIAQANLQDTVKGIITGRNGVINSERAEKPEDSGKFKMISVTLDTVFPDIRMLSEALVAIETQTPYLVIQELDMRVRNYTDPRELVVKLKVAALTGR
jgi:hypothetical protein